MDKDLLKELTGEIEIKKPKTQQELNKIKFLFSKKHDLKKIPSNIELSARIKDSKFSNILTIKPTRNISGVNVVAIMTKPFKCPHGKCIYCPGGVESYFGDVPQSYTGHEPASMRARRNKYDAYLQVMNRLEQYSAMNKLSGKIEMIVMGGTFPSFPLRYQENFVCDAFKAQNDFSDLFFKNGKFDSEKFTDFFELPGNVKNEERTKRIQNNLLKLKEKSKLEIEQKKNETSKIRCVALCVETRPDFCRKKHINEMLKLGVTRVELGVQTIYDDILKKIKRGHSVEDSIKATQLLKDSFLKVGYHMMPGLPGSDFEKDLNYFKEVFSNPDFKPDAIKIYPCMVMPGTKLYEIWKKGAFNPMDSDKAAELISEIKKFVPKYCRIMRIQRDIPTNITSAGVDKTNLRQYIGKKMKEKNIKCNCIRCREPRAREINFNSVKLNVEKYEASHGIEYFISFDDMKNDILVGYSRLRIPYKPFRKEITKNSAGIRELHVFGKAAAIGEEGIIQHHGFGKRLMEEAERIAKEEFDCNKILVISGIGAKEYYRKKLNYRDDGVYLSRII